ncbi:MAG: MBL fold metallo-hydrolase [Armatimonadetes bacterium]|nr:MBL fold metallo-hydrolase [Armatimonadota bacterium]
MIVEQLSVGPVQANCYVVGENEGGRGLVIDPGDESPRILEVVARHGLRIAAVVCTHAHFDHIGAVAEVCRATGAPFLIHTGEREMLEAAPERAEMMLGIRIPAPPTPDRWLAEGDEVTAGTLRFRVAFTPGHAPGHITLIGDGVAFDGDVLFAGSIGRTDLPGGSLEVLLRSIARTLLVLPDETVLYPGHGPPTTVGRERLTNPFLAGLMPLPD